MSDILSTGHSCLNWLKIRECWRLIPFCPSVDFFNLCHQLWIYSLKISFAGSIQWWKGTGQIYLKRSRFLISPSEQCLPQSSVSFGIRNRGLQPPFSIFQWDDKLHHPAIIVQSDLWIRKRGLTLKVHAFLICSLYNMLWVMVFSTKPVVSPTTFNIHCLLKHVIHTFKILSIMIH